MCKNWEAPTIAAPYTLSVRAYLNKIENIRITVALCVYIHAGHLLIDCYLLPAYILFHLNS